MTPTRYRRSGGALALALFLAACPDEGPQDPDPNVGDVTITTTTLANATQCEVYAEGVNAEGGNGEYHWEIFGDIPDGIELNVEDLTDDDLVITGIPQDVGSFDFSLRVETTEGERFTRDFTLVVLPAVRVVIESPALPPALVGASYQATLNGCPGGTSTVWSLAGGTLPAGLTLNPNGTITGTATAADTAQITVRAVQGSFETTRVFTLQAVANRTASYDITVVPVVPVPAALQPALDAAIARLQSAITGDLSTIPIAANTFEDDECGGFGSVVNGTTAEDLILLVNIGPIDGPGQVLGFAGPCIIRNSNQLPVVGILTLDAADLAGLSGASQIALVTHETAHVLGFGSLWEGPFDLVTASPSDPRFTGAAATAQYNALGAPGQPPVEDEGGEGTSRSHWNEETFGAELMTGFANLNVFQPFSRMSIASFADMGYAVNLNAADAYALATPGRGPEASAGAAAIGGYDVVVDYVIGALDEQGRMTATRRQP